MNSIRKRELQKVGCISYTLEYWKDYDFSILQAIPVKRISGRGKNQSYAECIICADTETSKKKSNVIYENHVVAWTISINSIGHNICTLYGGRPDYFIECFNLIRDNLKGENIYCWFHNMSYDYVFLRKFMYSGWSYPVKQLNTKPHYPIIIQFENGLIFRDSLILAGRSLEKWAKDLDVEHKKSVGKWDYEKIRDQIEYFTHDELEYIEHDTLAGVECLNKTMETLHKHVYSIPYTQTGIVREGAREAGKRYNAHDNFILSALDFNQLQKAEKAYHGGFTHGNRHFLNMTIDESFGGYIKGYDFASSYPFIMLTHRMAIGKFNNLSKNYAKEEILKLSDKYAFIFTFIAVGIKLKDDLLPMPPLQMFKCDKTVNAIIDNGRILAAEYIKIELTEIDLELIDKYYDIQKSICINVMYAAKGLLPKWFRDYVYQCFVEKTSYKGGDPVLYAIAKAKLNSLYGMTVQHPVKPTIEEDYDTGEYKELENENMEDLYNKYVQKKTSIFPYQWGVYVTAYAMKNLFTLGEMCDIWLYSDTDSVYGIGWDIDKVKAYNNKCIEMMKAAGYDGVRHNGRVYYLGVAEHDEVEDTYTQFRYCGAKRYCGRSKSDDKLHITVAGVPKVGAECLNDDINNFTTGMIFKGSQTGKKTHTYFYKEDITTDERGNLTGDSIDLSLCDYLLKSEEEISIDGIMYDDITIQNYEDR